MSSQHSTSVASSTIRSRLQALTLQVEQERLQRQRVETRIKEFNAGTDTEVTLFPIAAAFRAAPIADSFVKDFVATCQVPGKERRQTSPDEVSNPQCNVGQIAVPKRPSRIVTSRVTRIPSPPRKPMLPDNARGSRRRNDVRAGYSLVGRRRPTESELYVSKMRHEDRMKQVRQFSLDV